MLSNLVLKHSIWVKMARKICKDKYLADDIVSEMYLKLADYKKDLNGFYIYATLKSCYIDWLRKEKQLNECELIENIIFEEAESDTEIKVTDCLTWVEKQILTLRFDHSLRDIEKQYKINYVTVSRIEAKAKAKVWQEQKKYKASAML